MASPPTSFHRHLKSTSTRVLMALVRRISKIFQFLYVLLITIPVLWVKKLVSFPCLLVSGHGAVLILSRELVVKVASSTQSTLLVEYDNSTRMRQTAMEGASCVPSYCMYRHSLFSCLITERYQNVPFTEVLDCAVEIRRNLDSAGLSAGGMSFDNYWQLQVGLKCVSDIFGSALAEQLSSRTKQYLEEGAYSVGLCHGDFHSRNIMRDKLGNACVIDLDCVRFEGIVELDAVYFAIEMEWSVSGAPWMDTLATAYACRGVNLCVPLRRFDVQWDENLGLVYFLDRIGQEVVNYGFRHSEKQMNRLLSAIART